MYDILCSHTNMIKNKWGSYLNETILPGIPTFEKFNLLPPELKVEIIKKAVGKDVLDGLQRMELVSNEWYNLINTFVGPALLREKFSEEQIGGVEKLLNDSNISVTWKNVFRILTAPRQTVTVTLDPTTRITSTQNIKSYFKPFFWRVRNIGQKPIEVSFNFWNREERDPRMFGYHQLERVVLSPGERYQSALYKPTGYTYSIVLICGLILQEGCRAFGEIIELDL